VKDVLEEDSIAVLRLWREEVVRVELDAMLEFGWYQLVKRGLDLWKVLYDELEIWESLGEYNCIMTTGAPNLWQPLLECHFRLACRCGVHLTSRIVAAPSLDQS
jgi:hypothetical protein